MISDMKTKIAPWIDSRTTEMDLVWALDETPKSVFQEL